MNFRQSFVPALVVAFCLHAPIAAHAGVVSSQPRLTITPVCGQGAHLFDIRNVGVVTSGVLRYRLVARAYESMPALKTWDLPLFPLAPGQVFHLSVPSSAWGLKLSLEVDGGMNGSTVLAATSSGVDYPNLCW